LDVVGEIPNEWRRSQRLVGEARQRGVADAHLRVDTKFVFVSGGTSIP